MTAQNSRTQISYIEESVYGTTPNDPAMTVLPVNTFSVVLEKGVIEDNGLYPDEMIRNIRHGDRMVSGDMSADLRKTDFHPYLESVMRTA